MAHLMLIYHLAPDYFERRAEFRAEHLAMARAAVDRGEILVGGALAPPASMTFIAFQGETGAAAEAFANADPYVVNGLVKSWEVREWLTVVGPVAANPL
jgi:uncharacterized protein YciI